MDALRIRPATAADVPAITAIYGDQVLHGTASWEYDPPDEAEVWARMRAIIDKGFPYLAAELDGHLAGYSYASAWRGRIGYRYTVENSIYIRSDLRGRGLGRRLLTALIDECTARGYRQMIAVIGDSANAASISLHRACGFEQAGLFRSVGFKFNRWLDGVWMQRPLGAGDSAPPEQA